MQNKHPTPPLRGGIYTLAQSETGNSNKPVIIVNGNGSELSNSKAIRGKVKRKVITQTTVLSLIDAAKGKDAGERQKGYWNTFHCQNKIITANGRLYGKYCKNRFCTLCCAIRKADIINKYLPTIQKWPAPYFVTLTVKAHQLKYMGKLLKKVMAAFKRINEVIRKRHQRGKSIKLVGVKSLECNFNPTTKTYNPHLHLIVETKEMAELLIGEWLKLWKKAKVYTYVSPKAQHMKPIEDREKQLIELIKYGSKIFTEPDVNNKSNSKTNGNIHAAALDNIFTAMKGLRIFDRFGFNLQSAKARDTKATVINDYDVWEFDAKTFNWINLENEEALSDYIPPPALLELLQNRIDVCLE